MTEANAIDYFEHKYITEEKGFIALGPGVNLIKLFGINLHTLLCKLDSLSNIINICCIVVSTLLT